MSTQNLSQSLTLTESPDTLLIIKASVNDLRVHLSDLARILDFIIKINSESHLLHMMWTDVTQGLLL